MGSLPIMGIPYRAAMSGNWKSMLDHYQERVLDVPFPVTLSADTALHLAVYSKQEQPLKDLLDIVKDIKSLLPETEFLVPDETESPVPETESPVPETESHVPEIEILKRKNKFGNTALHEATIYGNYEAARLLVERCPDLLLIRNEFGETPLFTAAGFAEAEIVEFLITSKPEKCVDDKCRILSIHRKRTEDDLSILSAAIRGQHFGNNYYSLYIILNFKKYTHIYKISYNSSMPNFMNAETALLLLELDDSLHKLKDKDGVTALQLLAQMPTAFESGFPMGICERLIYCCMPTLTTLLDLTILPPYFLSVYHGHTHTLLYVYICMHTHI
jgi:ankyrin repeat protein